jgi:hypothetical protein
MKVEVEFSCDLDPNHPDRDKMERYQALISEDELPTITKDDLRRLHITWVKLMDVFAKARELMRDVKPSDRVRVIADRGWEEDEFHVCLCRYSPMNDPMLQRVKGSG